MERVNNFVKVRITCGMWVDRTARQQLESALCVFLYLDFQLILHDVKLH